MKNKADINEYIKLQKDIIKILLKTIEIKDDTIRLLKKRGD